MLGYIERREFSRIAKTEKNIEDKEKYTEMLNKLIDALVDKPTTQLNATLVLADFLQENSMFEKANKQIQKTGFITEDAWIILGPFDNSNEIGYDTTYIQEESPMIDLTAKYDGLNGQVSWEKFSDEALDAYIHLGEYNVDWRVSYIFATVTSPDERKAQIRWDSDDQGKVWLNGKQISAHTKTFAAEIDKYTIPVTLKQGKNNILVKVCNRQSGWGFYLRITDQNGKPFDDLKIHSAMQN